MSQALFSQFKSVRLKSIGAAFVRYQQRHLKTSALIVAALFCVFVMNFGASSQSVFAAFGTQAATGVPDTIQIQLSSDNPDTMIIPAGKTASQPIANYLGTHDFAPKDQLVTVKGQAEVILKNDAILLVQPDSQITLDNLWDGGPLAFTLTKGEFYLHVGGWPGAAIQMPTYGGLLQLPSKSRAGIKISVPDKKVFVYCFSSTCALSETNHNPQVTNSAFVLISSSSTSPTDTPEATISATDSSTGSTSGSDSGNDAGGATQAATPVADIGSGFQDAALAIDPIQKGLDQNGSTTGDGQGVIPNATALATEIVTALPNPPKASVTCQLCSLFLNGNGLQISDPLILSGASVTITPAATLESGKPKFKVVNPGGHVIILTMPPIFVVQNPGLFVTTATPLPPVKIGPIYPIVPIKTLPPIIIIPPIKTLPPVIKPPVIIGPPVITRPPVIIIPPIITKPPVIIIPPIKTVPPPCLVCKIPGH